MSGILISMLILTLILFASTRMVWIYVIKDDGLSFEIHLPVIAIRFSKSKDNKKSKKSRKSLQEYRILAKPILKLLENSEIIINKVAFPEKTGELSNSTFTRPYKYQSVFFALYAYLKSKSEKLTLRSNAVVLSSDSNALLYNFTVKLRLYQLIFAAISIFCGKAKEKLQRG